MVTFTNIPATFNSPSTMDNELMRVWQLVHELSDQLSHNQKLTNTLQSQAGSLKVLGCTPVQFMSLNNMTCVESGLSCRLRVLFEAV